jgi:hypothetical protein
VFVTFVGEAIKMCANIFYVLMNVNRYMLIGNTHNPTLEKISKWDTTWVVGLSIGVSLLLNVGHIFQYSLNEKSIYLSWFDPYVLSFYQIYPYNNAQNFLSVQIYLFVYFFVNFLIFFIVSTAVDVIIVRKLHAELKGKKKKTEEMKARVSADQISFRKRRRQEIEDRSEQRAVLMVIINALVSFFSGYLNFLLCFHHQNFCSTLIFCFSFLNLFQLLKNLPMTSTISPTFSHLARTS